MDEYPKSDRTFRVKQNTIATNGKMEVVLSSEHAL